VAGSDHDAVPRQRQIDDEFFEKWKAWIDRIYDGTVTLFAFRSFYQGLAEITQTNGQIWVAFSAMARSVCTELRGLRASGDIPEHWPRDSLQGLT
jgi:hypothetical protein